MKDRIFEASHFVRHWWIGKWRHGVHSPFVFHLTSYLLQKKRTFLSFEHLNLLRRELLHDRSEISVLDLGAGSRLGNSSKKRIQTIAKSALAPKVQAEALFKLIEFLQPRTILELGTSLGLTTLYFSEAAPKAKIYTIEGSPAIASFAAQLFERQQATNIEASVGDFDEVLPLLLKNMGELDFVYLDGNHTYDATLRYFTLIAPHLTSKSIVVVDDIYWSKEMHAAWENLWHRPEVSLSLDFFHFGVLMFEKRLTKEHFLLNGLLFNF